MAELVGAVGFGCVLKVELTGSADRLEAGCGGSVGDYRFGLGNRQDGGSTSRGTGLAGEGQECGWAGLSLEALGPQAVWSGQVGTLGRGRSQGVSRLCAGAAGAGAGERGEEGVAWAWGPEGAGYGHGVNLRGCAHGRGGGRGDRRGPWNQEGPWMCSGLEKHAPFGTSLPVRQAVGLVGRGTLSHVETTIGHRGGL